MVTAEAAIALLAVVALAVALIYVVSAVGAHVQAVDAAREAARSVARGDSDERAREAALAVAPAGAAVQITRGSDQVAVTVQLQLRPMSGLLGTWTVTATSVARLEPSTVQQEPP